MSRAPIALLDLPIYVKRSDFNVNCLVCGCTDRRLDACWNGTREADLSTTSAAADFGWVTLPKRLLHQNRVEDNRSIALLHRHCSQRLWCCSKMEESLSDPRTQPNISQRAVDVFS